MTDELTTLDAEIDFEAMRSKYRPLRDETHTTCKVCGTPTGSALKATCSNACRQALYRARLKVKQQQAAEAA